METIQDGERLFDPSDVFFSTTDRKGVIRNANRTFVTLARHPREELIGAPHNIIRHDDVPAGVFKLMWDDLEAGRPVCTYVLNRAGDGLDYWVFATVSSVEDGYVSVRTKPLEADTFSLVRDVYSQVRAVEREAAEAGSNRREVAERGAQVLLEKLAGLGFSSLLEFSMSALPAEAVSLAAEGVRVPVREEVEGPAATVLGGARDVELASATLVGQATGYRSIQEGLSAWMSEAPAIATRAERTRELVGMLASNDPESSVPSAAERVTNCTSEALGGLSGLTDAVASLTDAISRLGFRASLMRLHTLVLGSYAASVVDGDEEDVRGAMTELHHALATDLSAAQEVCTEVAERRDALDAAMRVVVSGLDRSRRPFDRWLRALRDEGASLREGVEADGVDVGNLLDEADGLSSTGFPEMSSLANLAARCRGLDLTLDRDAMGAAETAIVNAVAEME